MTKNEVRRTVKERVKTLNELDKNYYSNVIAGKLYRLDEYKRAKNVFVYNSLPSEVSTAAIIITALNMNKRVLLPIVDGADMHIVEISRETTYSPNRWGILEPDEPIITDVSTSIDLAIIPLVGFDSDCNRLGRGKGYYDKFLSSNPCFKVALAYSAQLVEKLPCEAHDVPMDKIITECEVYRSIK